MILALREFLVFKSFQEKIKSANMGQLGCFTKVTETDRFIPKAKIVSY